eukprot:3069673-Lingulodinium_polyedra.AAC.1
MVTEALAQQQQRQEQQKLYTWVCATLKRKPDLLLPVKAIIESHDQKMTLAEKHFPRGVRYFTGESNKAVPTYGILEALSCLTHVDKSFFMNLDNSAEGCRYLLMFMMGVTNKHPLPAKQMALPSFVNWCESLWLANGKALNDVAWKSMDTK